MNPLIAEFIGTMILIILGDGVVANVVLKNTKGNNSGWIVITTGWGLAVFTAVFMVGRFSGAHLNPAVTVGLAIAGSFGTDFFTGWNDVPTYILAQLAGAFVGAIIVWITYYQHFDAEEDAGNILGTFSTGPAMRNPLWNLITEAVGTFVLVFGVFLIVSPALVLDAATMPEALQGAVYNVDAGALGALPVGLLVWVIGLSLGGPTGYAINPARDLGPRIAHLLLPIKNKGGSDWGYSWIPVVGPIIGAAIAAGLYMALLPA